MNSRLSVSARILTLCTIGALAGVPAGGSPDQPTALGSAAVVVDGQRETWRLQTGFFVETNFEDPKRATILYSVTDWEMATSPRRFRLTLDATRAGRRSTADADVEFLMIEEGGQMYFPSAPCSVQILSAYTGESGSVYAGRIPRCRVESAGIDHTISAEFEMKGNPYRD